MHTPSWTHHSSSVHEENLNCANTDRIQPQQQSGVRLVDGLAALASDEGSSSEMST